MKKLVKNKLRELIISRMGVIPSILEDEYYTVDIVESFVKRHDLIWSRRSNNYGKIIFEDCLFKFKSSQVYLYLKKRENENTYSIKIYFEEKNLDSVRFLVSSIKENKTI